MVRSYLTVAIRNLLRQKAYSLINVAGLAIGLMSVILIGLFIKSELSYDSYHADGERKYRMIRETHPAGKEPWSDVLVTPGLGPALKDEYPEVETTARIIMREVWARSGRKVYEHVALVTEPSLFDILTIPMVSGDWQTALAEPSAILMSESAAQKFFPDSDPIGKSISLEDNEIAGRFTVTGVIKDLPRNSTFRFDFLTVHVDPKMPLANIWDEFQRDASYRPGQVLVKLREGVDHGMMEAKVQSILDKYVSPQEAAITTYFLQPLSRVRLHTKSDYGIQNRLRPFETYGSIDQVNAYALVALFLMVIACVNFVNLSTARASRRAREVGIRKASGAIRAQLVRQFLGESMLLSLLSVALAAGLAVLLLPYFSDLCGRDLSPDALMNPLGVLTVVGIGVLVGLLAGIYPAFFLSRFDAAEVLRGEQSASSASARFRKAMVILQFALSIVFVIATLTVRDQLHYIRSKDLGFLKEGVIEMDIFFASRKVTGMRPLTRQWFRVREAFERHPNILKATSTRFGQGTYATMGTYEAEGVMGDVQLGVFDVDETYMDFYGIEILAGRNFSYRDVTTEEGTFRVLPRWVKDHPVGIQAILNETAAKLMGWSPQEAIGKRIKGKRWDKNGTVIAVVKDFHTRSLHREVEPVIFGLWPGVIKYLHVKLGNGDVPETLEFLKETWNQFLPARPFSFVFLEDRLLYQDYAQEIRTENVIRVFSALAVFVACLGLLGLVSYMAERRTKEIGVRRTLGAPVSGVMFLLTKDFLMLVVVANLIAWPVAYYAMRDWLAEFAYRVDLSLLLFLAAGIGALAIAALTVAYQAFRAASTDPVKALRTE